MSQTYDPASVRLEQNSVAISPQKNYSYLQTAASGDVSADFCRYRVLRDQRGGSPRPLISVF
jgi:hypothetical protein